MNLFGHFDGVVRAMLSDMVKAGELPDGLDLSKLVAESLEEGKRAMEERERELRDAYGS